MSQITVQSLWIDPIVGDLQILCIKSFLKQGTKFVLFTYGVIEHLPEGVLVKDANKILDKSKVFKDNKNSYATFSDWFRIKLLYDIGGWWVDCDVLCIKSFSTKQEYVFATERFGPEGMRSLTICNAIIKMPKRSAIGTVILARIDKKLADGNVLGIYWTEIGAQLLLDEIRKAALTHFIVAPEVFCPTDYNNFRDLIDKQGITLDERTFGIHLWNKMWEWNNLNPMDVISEDSILAKAKLNLK